MELLLGIIQVLVWLVVVAWLIGFVCATGALLIMLWAEFME